jgi:hypothetical protein
MRASSLYALTTIVLSITLKLFYWAGIGVVATYTTFQLGVYTLLAMIGFGILIILWQLDDNTDN